MSISNPCWQSILPAANREVILPPIRFARLDPQAKPPARKHLNDAGIDVYANETVVVAPFSAARISTGLTFDIQPGYMLLAKPKSGSDFLLGAGVIDPGYQGEILIKVVNYTPNSLTITRGDALAQLVQVVIQTDALEEVSVEEIHPARSSRGRDGGIVRQQP
jgi:dUTP pyrophosphatase